MGITCENCNNTLGRFESQTIRGLAIATLWKVIAGNINCVFGDKSDWALLSNTKLETLTYYEALLKHALLNNKIFPENMLGYDLTRIGISGENESLHMSILTDFEGVCVLQDKVLLENKLDNDVVIGDIDVLVYRTHYENSDRMLFILPCISPTLKVPWINTEVIISHSSFGEYAARCLEFERGVSLRLYKIY